MSGIQQLASIVLIGATVFFMLMTVLPKNDQRDAFWLISGLMVIVSSLLGLYQYNLGWEWLLLALQIYACSFTLCWTINVLLRRNVFTKPIIFGSLICLVLSSIDYFFI